MWMIPSRVAHWELLLHPTDSLFEWGRTAVPLEVEVAPALPETVVSDEAAARTPAIGRWSFVFRSPASRLHRARWPSGTGRMVIWR